MKKKAILIGVATVLLFALCFAFLQMLLMPKYMSAPYLEGAMIQEYYDNAGGNDVVFIGDCEVYENFSPITLWEEYGIPSYIRGSAQQYIWQSYYLLEETLRYETPKVVVFNVLSMKYDATQSEPYNRMLLDGMKWSPTKVQAVRACIEASERAGVHETFLSYVFPLLRFHSRWSDLGSDDVEYLFSRRTVTHNGYLMRVDVNPVEYIPTPDYLAPEDAQLPAICYDYLDRMTKLCQDNGIELVLIKAPSVLPFWYDVWDAQMEEYAAQHGLAYYNFLDEEHLTASGIDYSTDTYDGGLHLNLSGAEKMSVYFGKILQERFDLPDRRGDAALAAKWQEKADAYYAMEADQRREIEEYGYPVSYALPPES